MFLWGKKVEAATDLIFLGPKITADVECNHEIKRYFLLGRKAMTNLDSVLKSRDIILPTKVHIFKTMVFPVVMYKCESWITKKPEGQRTDAFKSHKPCGRTKKKKRYILYNPIFIKL